MTNPGAPEADLAARFIDARNHDLDERSRLFVARHKTTGLYSKNVQCVLHSSASLQYGKPTVEKQR
jgi:hypothetical protein